MKSTTVAMRERLPIVISPQTGQFTFNNEASTAVNAANRSVIPSTSPFNWYLFSTASVKIIIIIDKSVCKKVL